MRRLLACALALALSGCAYGGGDAASTDVPVRDPAAQSSEAVDPDAPTGWGPTAAELERAEQIVSGWSDEQLAGGVIVGRFHGTDPAEPARMVRDLHLAGVSVTGDNVADEAQVLELTSQVVAAAQADGRSFPPVLGVDQEGGYVSHLRGVATEFPHFQSAGTAIEQDRRAGRLATRQAALWTGLELRQLGFTWVFAPVADVTIGSADPTIGPRSPSSDPAVATDAVAAAVRGFNRAGVVSTTKHFPGHGAATSDSHDTLPELASTLDELTARDLPPFRGAVAHEAPAVMMSHLDVTAVEPGVPASLAPGVYDLLRDDLGFDGVAITDSLGMGAVGGRPKPAVQALAAGADLLLMPVDTDTTHRLVARAIETGEVPRERVLEAAGRVVALQLWQQRVAARRPVPVDVRDRAAAASAALLDAAY